MLPRRRPSRAAGVPRRRARAIATAAAMVAAATAVGCTDADGETASTTTGAAEVTGDPAALDHHRYGEDHATPYPPIAAEVGERFSLVLGAEPRQGFRWVVDPVDPAVLVALGTEFVASDDAGIETVPTTTTAPPPPPESLPAPPGPTITEAPAPEGTAPPETTAPAPPPSTLQVISFVTREQGTGTIVVRYVGAGEPTGDERTLTFTVEVATPPPLGPTG